jgi:pyruvate dehydrogenase E1 component alpha subunit
MAQVVEKKKSGKKRSVPHKSDSGIGKKTYLQWYEVMLRIRKFEERSLMMYAKNKIRGFLHVYIGQEAIAAALTSAIRPSDAIITAYRQHGIAIARGISTRLCMAELFAKKTGINKGKGGSMHFFSREHNYFGGNGIVGAQIPIGTGIALAEQYKGTDNICLTMFGDGASRQGSLHESFNMAMTWKLPVLYICENNQYAMGTSVERTSNVQDLYKLGHSYNMPSSWVNGMDPNSVHEALTKAANHVRSGNGPYLLEIKTYRYRGHSVSDPARYRSKEELASYKDQDPIEAIEMKLLEKKFASQSDIDKIRENIKTEIDEAVAFADESPMPDPEELYDDNYSQPGYPFLT